MTFSPVFADYANVSCFKDEDFMPGVFRILEGIGLAQVFDNLWRAGGGGTVKIISNKRHSDRHTLSLSGQVLATLRMDGLLPDVVQEMSTVPVRVAQLHAARDEFRGSVHVRLQELLAQGRAGQIKLGRKALKPSQVEFRDQLDDRGDVTGTVYLGHRHKQRLSIHAYDKRWERICRGFDDPGDTLRIEVVAKQGSACLNDILEPTSMFYSIASDIVDLPEAVPPWQPSELFIMPTQPREIRATAERFLSTLGDSADLRRLATLAAESDSEIQRAWYRKQIARQFDSLLAKFDDDESNPVRQTV